MRFETFLLSENNRCTFSKCLHFLSTFDFYSNIVFYIFFVSTSDFFFYFQVFIAYFQLFVQVFVQVPSIYI